LPQEMTVLLKDAVNSGSYSSASEVVREALRDWQEKQIQKGIALKQLRRAWKIGVGSGPAKPFSMERIKAQARRRLEERGKKIA
jgi:antitoxin ParD1/3/4